MCGILGGWNKNYEPDSFKVKIKESLTLMLHRGPDDSGYEIFSNRYSGNIFLAHARLSIIDLTASGHQPMSDLSGRYTIIFNGEIYNYIEIRNRLIDQGFKFRTNSDTEVLLCAWIAWGEKCLIELIGMFAFVIYDKIMQTLTCVRDAFGIKPFYYEYEQESFLFSSELESLLKLRSKDVKPNIQRAYDYLVHGNYDSNENTFVDGVKHLMPGHIMTINFCNEITEKHIKKWWDASNITQNDKLSFEESTKLVREKFLESIRLHLRSDVPLGFALSGGIDSSAIVCAVKHIEPSIEINTFSYIATDSHLSEEIWIDKVNNYTKSIPHKVEVTQEELLSDLDKLIKVQGEPFGSTSIYAQYRVFKLAKERGIKVILDGQGADELLAGYDGYPGERLLSLIERGNYLKALFFSNRWSRFPGRTFKQAWMLLIKEILPHVFLKAARRYLGRNYAPDWINIDVLKKECVKLEEIRVSRQKKFRGRRVIEKLAYSLQRRGIPHLLRHEDRNSMCFSIESRVPFLTIEIANLLLSFPEEYLISHDGETKHIFREAMRGIVPDEILDRKDKIGFATPEEDWLLFTAPRLRRYIEKAGDIEFINLEKLLGAFDGIVNKKQTFTWQMWRWVNYVIWFKQYITQNKLT